MSSSFQEIHRRFPSALPTKKTTGGSVYAHLSSVQSDKEYNLNPDRGMYILHYWSTKVKELVNVISPCQKKGKSLAQVLNCGAKTIYTEKQ